LKSLSNGSCARSRTVRHSGEKNERKKSECLCRCCGRTQISVDTLRKQVPHPTTEVILKDLALSLRIRVDPWPRNTLQNKCGPGQPPEPHRFVEFLRCLVTAGRWNDASGPTAFLRTPHLPKAQLPVRDLAISNCNLCGGQRSFLLYEQVGEEAAMPRATSTRKARFSLVPR
jgi:hypothetical protein